jgi:DNA-binding response OmpR family regulator
MHAMNLTHILVVEDESIVAFVLTRRLTRWGYTVQTASSFCGSSSNGMKLGKAKREGYRTFRDLQFNSFAISTLFRA